MRIPTNEISLQQLPSQHIKIHQVIETNSINDKIVQNPKQLKINQKH